MFAEKNRKARSEKPESFWLEEWHFERKMFDIINDSLPERSRARLKDRPYREGASREGKALEEYRKMHRKRLRAGNR